MTSVRNKNGKVGPELGEASLIDMSRNPQLNSRKSRLVSENEQ